MLVSKTDDYRANPGREQEELVECPTCRKRLSSRSILIRHLCETHQTNLHQQPINIRTFRCLEAGCKSGPFKRKSQLCSHKQAKHTNGPKDSGKEEIRKATNSESFQQDLEYPYYPNLEKEAQEVDQGSMKTYPSAPRSIDLNSGEKTIRNPFLEVSDTDLLNQGNGAAINGQALPNINRSYSKLPQSLFEVDGFQDTFLGNFAEPDSTVHIPGLSPSKNLIFSSSKADLERDNGTPPKFSLKDYNGEFIPFLNQKDEIPDSDIFSSMENAEFPNLKSHSRFEVSLSNYLN